jgi:MerR family transcriptional regulator, light-induced transcriptional regulator
MGKYSIKDLEQLSGIKAHTIRIWEKRHKLIDPSRTPTNIRYYSDEDLKKIINVSLLNNHGLKISRIADMTLEQINQKILELSQAKNDSTIHIDQLVIAMVDMEEESFEKILNNMILRFGFESTISNVIYPFLEKIGILWQTENITPAHEHFMSNLIRQKLIVAIDGLPMPLKTAKKVLLFLPEGELHELPLLFYYYITRKNGLRTYYLGQNVPHDDLVSIFNVHKPDLIITSIITATAAPVEDYLKRISADFPEIPILASGQQLQKFQYEKVFNVKPFKTVDQLKALIAGPIEV